MLVINTDNTSHNFCPLRNSSEWRSQGFADMLSDVADDDDWENVREHIVLRMAELGLLNLSALARDSKAVDPTGAGVSDATWRALRRGQPLPRLDKRNLVCKVLLWREDAFEIMLRGGDPVSLNVDEPIGRIDDHDARITRLENQVRQLVKMLLEARNGGAPNGHTLSES